MSDLELHERVTRIETRQDTMYQMLETHVEREDRDRDCIMASLSQIRQDMSRQRGFWAGVVFLASGIVTIATIALSKWSH